MMCLEIIYRHYCDPAYIVGLLTRLEAPEIDHYSPMVGQMNLIKNL